MLLCGFILFACYGHVSFLFSSFLHPPKQRFRVTFSLKFSKDGRFRFNFSEPNNLTSNPSLRVWVWVQPEPQPPPPERWQV